MTVHRYCKTVLLYVLSNYQLSLSLVKIIIRISDACFPFHSLIFPDVNTDLLVNRKDKSKDQRYIKNHRSIMV